MDELPTFFPEIDQINAMIMISIRGGTGQRCQTSRQIRLYSVLLECLILRGLHLTSMEVKRTRTLRPSRKIRAPRLLRTAPSRPLLLQHNSHGGG